MGKYEFIKNKNIVSVHKTLKLSYEEDFNGETKEIEVRIYPYTVEEKLEISNMAEEAQALSKSENKEDIEKAKKLYDRIATLSAYYILKKDDKDIDEETVNKMPNEWLNQIATKALEFEGITKDKLESNQKKD